MVRRLIVLAFALAVAAGVLLAGRATRAQAPVSPLSTQSQEEADRKSAGCVSCHTQSDAKSMHASPSVRLGCVDCHGGNASVKVAGSKGSRDYQEAQRQAHVQPKDGEVWPSAANPERSYTALLKEDLEFVRFVNPSDLRAAPVSCGPCHRDEVKNVSKSMMTHGGMLYGAALYNNGVLPGKDAIVGESYGADGRPRMLKTIPPPTPEETRDKGVLAALVPFPRWELGQPGNPFRVFERGGRRRLEVGLPDIFEEPGKPDKGLSPRGPGTLNRTDPIILGAQKTRLLDPMTSFLGTNDHPGDYRASGCAACHVVYANDRSKSNSGPYAAFGNRGATQTVDPTIPKDQSGHPLKHVFTRAIPSSQCMTCHMHPGTNMVATYLGYTWWDNEVDGQVMYPKDGKTLSPAQRDQIEQSNPDGAALRGLWSDRSFLADVSTLNPKLKNTQFADFHGHGWVFRAVFNKDRKGNLLDGAGKVVPPDDPDKFRKAVHLKDIHLEKGMHCVDCHFKQDSHGNGKLYGEPRAGIEIDCVDCHGTITAPATLVTSGPASPGTDLSALSTPFGQPRFSSRRGKITQRSMVTDGVEWDVPQVLDTITPGNPRYSEKSRLAKTMQRDGQSWGNPGVDAKALAHANSSMTCYACHSAWTTSCFGCHLSMRANQRKPMLHSEGRESRNWTSYNFQTLRDDVYFLARDGSVTKNRIAPARSACAVVVSSQNQNREWIYSQQQTVSSGGFSGTAFSTYVPHTVRAKETRGCQDCHVAKSGDNNAWMAQLLMQGTGLVNFIGRYAYVGEGEHGFEAVVVTEREEPQAVIGSKLHELAYPAEWKAHKAAGSLLKEAYHHGGDVRSLQLRGEYLFAAQGKDGLRIYDVAQVDQKGFSERLVSAPVSPLGQKLYVKTKDATSVALPSTMTIDPARKVDPANQERPVHPLYDYAYVTDREEGLVVVGPLHTLLDGDPRNNFVSGAGAFNEGGVLAGASSMAIAGTVGYVTTPRELVVLSLDDPVRPKLLAKVALNGPRAVAVQFRYAFVLDKDGLRVVDVTFPSAPRLVESARVPLKDPRGLYLARTYAYVAAGRDGLAIVDVERPESPRLDQLWNASGSLNDANDVKIGMTNGSAFAYVADGRNGLRVVQVISANDTPGAYGFSPRPTPELVASYRTHGPALALSRGVDRDRAVDETGHQLAVFGRRGARPFDRDEQQRMYLLSGKLFTVSDEPPGKPLEPKRAGP
jgi:hypothetical protein